MNPLFLFALLLLRPKSVADAVAELVARGVPMRKTKSRAQLLNLPFPVDVYAGPDGGHDIKILATSDDPESYVTARYSMSAKEVQVLSNPKQGKHTPLLLFVLFQGGRFLEALDF